MFWGLNLKPNRKYSHKTEKAFHISQAALDFGSTAGGPTQIYITVENERFLLCTLRKDFCEQAALDLNFSEGNEICFQSVGSGNVSLSGYVVDAIDDFLGDDGDDLESSSETEEVDLRQKLLNAKKAGKDKSVVKSDNQKEDDDEEDEDEEDDSFLSRESDDVDDEEEEIEEDDDDDEEVEEDDDDEEVDDDSEEEVQQPKAKQAKLEKPEKQQNGVVKQKDQKTDKKSKKELKKEKQAAQQQKQQPKAGAERVLSGGVKIVDLRVGNGADAKPGKRTQVYYEGRLLSNNKVFDSLKSGAGFKFSLGRGEVIKGWDVGVIGMKVGGKRRIVCPPHMAYGSRGSPPAIPPNSTLVFDVELKGIN